MPGLLSAIITSIRTLSTKTATMYVTFGLDYRNVMILTICNTDRLTMAKRAASVDDQRSSKRVRIGQGESQYLDNVDDIATHEPVRATQGLLWRHPRQMKAPGLS